MRTTCSPTKESNRCPSLTASLPAVPKARQDSDLHPSLLNLKAEFSDELGFHHLSTSTAIVMDVDIKHELDAKPLHNVKLDPYRPSRSPALVTEMMPPPKLEFSASPIPSPLADSPSSTTPTPPPRTPSASARKAAASAPPQLIGDLPVARLEALSTFNEIPSNNYQNKSLGRSPEALESMVCECSYVHGVDSEDDACGSNCINRLTQVECLPEDCRCRRYCQNQRFQAMSYANIEIVKTEKKGYGLRAEEDLSKDTFIYEYVGDVVNPVAFKRRMRDYALEGIQHFYFMMLQKNEFIDATKSGGIARFANHSCNPNCYVAKWTVGDYVRMGIFAKRNIKKNEELTFNYNVDRYGHQAQICYCGEPNCVGFIGGKTQTESDIATMDDLYLDALGITDEDDLMELKGTKKKKGRKIDDPDFMPTLKPIVEKEVPKVVQAIRQTQNRKVLFKLLTRIKISSDQGALRQIMRLRGYSLMTNVLKDHASDMELAVLAMECMATWPLVNRNKVEDSKVIVPVQACATSENEVVKSIAQKLIDHWDTLPLYTRIPKRGAQESEVVVLHAGDESVTKRIKSDINHKLDIVPLGKTAVMMTVNTVSQPSVNQEELELARNRANYEATIQARQSVQAIIASAASAAAAAEAAAIATAAAQKAEAEAIEQRAARKKNRPSKKVQSAEEKEANKERRLLKLVGAVVVKCMSKYSKSMDHDLFKKHAKELTQIISDKEKKSSSYKEGRLENLSDEKVAKIKKFAKEYIAKILRKMEKSSRKDRPSSSSTLIDTPSTSMNTPNSADGFDTNVKERDMSQEHTMEMDSDEGSGSDEDERGFDVDSNGTQAASMKALESPTSSMPISVQFTMESMDMDMENLHESSVLPSDPRRRPPLDSSWS